MTKIESLFAKAVEPGTVRVDPSSTNYTIPHTWGVYKLSASPRSSFGEQFRKGNRPVRQRELECELGHAQLVVLFKEEQLAIELASHLNKTEA